jgi:hypothetical protein
MNNGHEDDEVDEADWQESFDHEKKSRNCNPNPKENGMEIEEEEGGKENQSDQGEDIEKEGHASYSGQS